jgi:imidazolonepropionase
MASIERIRADFVLRRAGRLVTMEARPGDQLGSLSNGALAALAGRVVWTGPDREIESRVELDGDVLDAAGACVLPGLVDPHTHPVFAGARADEFAQRVSGVSYREQQEGERGIKRTVAATRAAPEDELFGLAVARAHRFLAHGTTTIEAKTGYGLDFDNEAKSLRVLARLSAATALRIVPTFLGAHVIPGGVDRAQYVKDLIERMLPAFRKQARFFDIWCESVAFNAGETREILKRAKELGYGLRVHAAQLGPGPGPSIAAEMGALSADHLEFATEEQAQEMARAGTVAVLCPGANFSVSGSPRPPLEAFRKAGLPLAIASDLNPGTSNSESLTFAMSLGCVLWGMTPAEVIAGATVHAARSLGLQRLAGRLAPGSFADLGVYDVEAPEELPYYVGVNRCLATVTAGKRWMAP